MKHYRWHKFVISFLRVVAGPIIRRLMRYKCVKYKGPDVPSIIISNHNTDLDPVLVELGFSRHMYFLASEHAFRNGFPSKLMKALFGPIPINKTRADVASVKEIIRRVKAGASICFFAEGDRSFNGETSSPAISAAKLVRASGADLITFRLTGGYLTSPRWSKKFRKGRMTGSVVNRYTSDWIAGKTDEQLRSAIEQDIYENAYSRQEKEHVRYCGKDLAEHIETVLYLCPKCMKTGTIKSEGNIFSCGCGLHAAYTETGFLEGDLPFTTIKQWDEWQSGQLGKIIDSAGEGPICADANQQLFEVKPAAGMTPAGEGPMSIDKDAFHCAGMSFPLESISRFAIAGKMTLLFSLKNGTTYEVRSPYPRSALKYREIFRQITDN